MKKILWGRILEKSNSCLCNADEQQGKVTHQHSRHATKKEQNELMIDDCGNPLKINLRDLRRILKGD